mmetsp:Transcript_6678/g.24309  ORF Transcript_6678/g.24309 Transcript_6678/m.24309 type:complete len:244 (-) Transcript_6678:66-797(-)
MWYNVDPQMRSNRASPPPVRATAVHFFSARTSMSVSSLVTSVCVSTIVRSFAPVSVNSATTSSLSPTRTNKSLPSAFNVVFKSSTDSRANFARAAPKRATPRLDVLKNVGSNTNTGTTSAPDARKAAARATHALSCTRKSLRNQITTRVRDGSMGSDVDFPIALAGAVVDVLVLERMSAKARENDGDVNKSAVCALLGAVASGAVNAYSRARTRVKCDEKRRMIVMRVARAQAVFESFAKRTQ